MKSIHFSISALVFLILYAIGELAHHDDDKCFYLCWACLIASGIIQAIRDGKEK